MTMTKQPFHAAEYHAAEGYDSEATRKLVQVSVERVVDGVRYRVSRVHEALGRVKWELCSFVSTWGKGGSWHREAFVLLDPTATLDDAVLRLLGEEVRS